MGELGGSVEFPSRADGGGSGSLMNRLEERIASLVARHREARKNIEELQSQLEDSAARIDELTRRVEVSDRLRIELIERVSLLIDRIDALDRSGDGG